MDGYGSTYTPKTAEFDARKCWIPWIGDPSPHQVRWHQHRQGRMDFIDLPKTLWHKQWINNERIYNKWMYRFYSFLFIIQHISASSSHPATFLKRLEPRSLPYLWVGKTCFALSNASAATTADDDVGGVDGTGTVDVSAVTAVTADAALGVPWGPGDGRPPVVGEFRSQGTRPGKLTVCYWKWP